MTTLPIEVEAPTVVEAVGAPAPAPSNRNSLSVEETQSINNGVDVEKNYENSEAVRIESLFSSIQKVDEHTPDDSKQRNDSDSPDKKKDQVQQKSDESDAEKNPDEVQERTDEKEDEDGVQQPTDKEERTNELVDDSNATAIVVFDPQPQTESNSDLYISEDDASRLKLVDADLVSQFHSQNFWKAVSDIGEETNTFIDVDLSSRPSSQLHLASTCEKSELSVPSHADDMRNGLSSLCSAPHILSPTEQIDDRLGFFQAMEADMFSSLANAVSQHCNFLRANMSENALPVQSKDDVTVSSIGNGTISSIGTESVIKTSRNNPTSSPSIDALDVDGNSILDEEAAISNVANNSVLWHHEDGHCAEMGFRGLCSCPHGMFGVAAIFLSLAAFTLTAIAVDRCDFIVVGEETAGRNLGLVQFESTQVQLLTDSCIYWFDSTAEGREMISGTLWKMSRGLSIMGILLGLAYVSFVCTASFMAYNPILFQCLAFVSLVFPLFHGISFMVLGSHACQEDVCQLGLGGLLMILGVIVWLLASVVLYMVPPARSALPRPKGRGANNPMYLVMALTSVISVIVIANVLAIFIFKPHSESPHNDSTPTPKNESMEEPVLPTDWAQKGAAVGGPYPDSHDYLSLSEDATVLSLLGRQSIITMEYADAYELWIQRGDEIPANAESTGWNSTDTIALVRASSTALSRDGGAIAIGSSNWVNAGEKYQFGRVQVWNYDLNSLQWLPKGQAILGRSKNDLFASKVALDSSGNILAVLASGQHGNKNPYVRVYSYMDPEVYGDDSGGTWFQLGQDLDLESTSTASGFAMSGDGSTIAVGNLHVGRLGMVIVWTLDENTMKWKRKGGNIGSKSTDHREDSFGESCALSRDGNTLIVGDPHGVPAFARVFQYAGDGWKQLGQDLNCRPSDGRCAHDVAISDLGSIVAFTGFNSHQMARVYVRSKPQGNWTQVGSDIMGPDSTWETQGTSVEMSGDGQQLAFGVTFRDTTTQLWKYVGDKPISTPTDMESTTVPSTPLSTAAPVSFVVLDSTQNVSSPSASTQTITNPSPTPYVTSTANATFSAESATVMIPYAWIGSDHFEDVYYFLFNTSYRIERYNTTSRQFMTSIALPDKYEAPTAMGINQQGDLYVAFHSKAYMYGPAGDLGEAKPFVESETDIIGLEFDGDIVFVNAGTNFYSVNGMTCMPIQRLSFSKQITPGTSISSKHKRIFGRAHRVIESTSVGATRRSQMWFKEYDETGHFVDRTNTKWGVDDTKATKTWMFPDQTRVLDDRGAVFSVTSTQMVYNVPSDCCHDFMILDLAWLGGEGAMIVLDNQGVLTAISQELIVVGNLTLGFFPRNLLVHNGEVLTFTPAPDAPHGIQVNRLSLDLMNLSNPERLPDPTKVPYTPEFIFTDKNSLLYLLSKGHSTIFVADPVKKLYTDAIKLDQIPKFVSYSKENHELYTLRENGGLYKVNLSLTNKTEVAITTLQSNPRGMATAGEYIFACDESGAVATHFTFRNDGTRVSAVDWNHIDTEYVWSEANRMMYFFRQADPTDLMMEEIFQNGTIGLRMDSFLNNNSGFQHPIRVDPSGSLVVLGSGILHDAKTLERLPTALGNQVVDVAFSTSEIRTIRTLDGPVVQIQAWFLDSFEQENSLEIPGQAYRLISLDETKTVAVTSDLQGVPSFFIIGDDATLVN